MRRGGVRYTRRTPGRAGLVLLVAAIALPLVTGCVPDERGESSEVELDGGRGADAVAPVFPDGEVPSDLVIEGIAFDLMSRPRDLSYWSPSREEAECAADGMVGAIGADRLLALGFRPGVEGSALNDLALTEIEMEQLGTAFTTCVDMGDAVASILYGDARVPDRAARCFADRLDSTGHLDSIALGWLGSARDDPFGGDTALAQSLMTAATICLPADSFDWPHITLPPGPTVIDVTALPGAASTAGEPDAAADTTTTQPPAGG